MVDNLVSNRQRNVLVFAVSVRILAEVRYFAIVLKLFTNYTRSAAYGFLSLFKNQMLFPFFIVNTYFHFLAIIPCLKVCFVSDTEREWVIAPGCQSSWSEMRKSPTQWFWQIWATVPGTVDWVVSKQLICGGAFSPTRPPDGLSGFWFFIDFWQLWQLCCKLDQSHNFSHLIPTSSV